MCREESAKGRSWVHGSGRLFQWKHGDVAQIQRPVVSNLCFTNDKTEAQRVEAIRVKKVDSVSGTSRTGWM